MTDREIRDAKITALRNEGHNLAEISKSVQLSRERVRQLLAEQGLRTMTSEDKVDATIAAWRASGELRRATDVAREHGLPQHSQILARLRRECAGLSLPDVKPPRGVWDMRSITRVIRRIAVEQGIDPATDWLKISDYAKWRREGDPSTATIGSHYIWSDVLEAAGFNRENRPSRGRRLGHQPLLFSDAELDAAVGKYLDSHPAKLNVATLEVFLMSHPELPSLATIRNRFRKRGIGSISGIFRDVIARR